MKMEGRILSSSHGHGGDPLINESKSSLLKLMCRYLSLNLIFTVFINLTWSSMGYADATYPHGDGDNNACFSEQSVSMYMGTYKVIAVDRYGGGLTSKAKANKYIGQRAIILSKERFASSLDDNPIKHPTYRILCFPVSHDPGDVPILHWGAHWGNFYGLGSDRKYIKVLAINDPASKESWPYDWFEIVQAGNKLQLWNENDGWLYKLEMQ